MNFELGSQESMNVPIWVIIGFQQRGRQDSQKLNIDLFLLPVNSAQCIIGIEKYPDAGLKLNYVDDDYSHGYGQTKEVFRNLKRDDILQPYISDQDFRSSNVRADDVGYIQYFFDKRFQLNFTASPAIKVEFKVDKVPIDINGYALV